MIGLRDFGLATPHSTSHQAIRGIRFNDDGLEFDSAAADLLEWVVFIDGWIGQAIDRPNAELILALIRRGWGRQKQDVRRAAELLTEKMPPSSKKRPVQREILVRTLLSRRGIVRSE
jgi:hypothetical protein